MDKIASFNNKLLFEGAYSDACQEYAEALCFHQYVKSKTIPTAKEIGVNEEDYLMGICDLTGELGRRAVSLTTKKKYKEVEEIKEYVDNIYGEFLKLDLRNGQLRKKFDAIKWNLKKIEEVVYDIKTK